MKRLNKIILGSVFSGFILFFVVACVSEPVNIDLPQNHPANPEAQETVFVPPPNPFQSHMEMKPVGSSPMTQKNQVPSHPHQMTHEMDQMDKNSMSEPVSGEEKQDHQH